MSLRIRFAIWFAVLVEIILTVVFLIIYFQSAEFRREEFQDRLRQKALTTQRLLLEVQGIDSSLLKVIDRNTLTTLNQENVQIFLGDNHLLYSSGEEQETDRLLNEQLIAKVRKEKSVKFLDPVSGKESIGLLVENTTPNCVVLATAYDLYGLRKLANLRSILILTWLLGLLLSVLLAFIYVRKIVGTPLANLTGQVSRIGVNALTSRVTVVPNQNELTTLAESFNALLDRLQRTFEAQRNFVQYASHELRTPIANMLSETENALSKQREAADYRNALQSLKEEQSRMVELTNSLLMLTRFENTQLNDNVDTVRIDEVLYRTVEEVMFAEPEYKVMLDFEHIPADESALQIQANEPLIRTAFRNLLENSCRYAVDHTAYIYINPQPDRIEIRFENQGTVLSKQEAKNLFTPFFRGGNTNGKRGHGLGLVIAQRIVQIHFGSLTYAAIGSETNSFILALNKKIRQPSEKA